MGNFDIKNFDVKDFLAKFVDFVKSIMEAISSIVSSSRSIGDDN